MFLSYFGLFHVSRDFQDNPYAFVYSGRLFCPASFVPVDYYQFCSAFFLKQEVVGGRNDRMNRTTNVSHSDSIHRQVSTARREHLPKHYTGASTLRSHIFTMKMLLVPYLAAE